ncbi:MAG: putative toxin-antitoxin system toxin component, PIN family [Chromatiaceae bacterium]|jgi:putative PIN family toxin of toxin-antitoxin system
MIPLVVDTNVLVAACLREEGSSRAVIKRCLRRHSVPLIGTALFTEYEDLMSRDALFARSPLRKEERLQLFKGFLAVCRWTDVYFAWRPNLPDEADNHLIELAVAGGAAAIVSRNVRDLMGGELRFPQVRILTPEQCLEAFP